MSRRRASDVARPARAKGRGPRVASRRDRATRPVARDRSPRATTTNQARAARTPSRRRRGLWIGAASLLILASLGVGARWVLQQPFFRVQHVTIIGLRHESRSAVLRVSGLGDRPPMWSLSARRVRARLERFAWIDTVSLQKRWPNSVVVKVTEASPVAVAFKSGHVLEYVSSSGRDLGVAPLSANLPTLSYAGVVTPWPYAKAARASAYVASRLPKAFAAQVSVISESTKGVISLKMTTPVTFVLGPATNLHAKFVAVASVIAHSTLGPGDVVDVTVPDELAVTGPPPS
ncbi:MAG: FtsQ-type POTRA domain-containing protein [Acidobacteriota bacterium]|nr:FtsQ-type POTRA domain-containing protein [Acidobacteriota bacterium]